MSLSLPPQATTLPDLLPRLQAVLTACMLARRDARLRVRAPRRDGMAGMLARHAVVDMPFSATEIGLLIEAVAASPQIVPPSPGAGS